jgi:hypothetical protein
MRLPGCLSRIGAKACGDGARLAPKIATCVNDSLEVSIDAYDPEGKLQPAFGVEKLLQQVKQK